MTSKVDLKKKLLVGLKMVDVVKRILSVVHLQQSPIVNGVLQLYPLLCSVDQKCKLPQIGYARIFKGFEKQLKIENLLRKKSTILKCEFPLHTQLHVLETHQVHAFEKAIKLLQSVYAENSTSNCLEFRGIKDVEKYRRAVVKGMLQDDEDDYDEDDYDEDDLNFDIETDVNITSYGKISISTIVV